ncbi:SulP family inorganic anion transporter [Tabrizicola oligotrophica]|uniref:STAS domain-containing protein n=1 Tax=Tabrizicola oligotrophica TaxID=2710650 RepID=A0A6M0QWG5_9RHOB|nr:SulP family inorganic anion transporter [Tabrizicola oligotrophica]NEY90852.1 STAS domain-containing protein [Tabrizicola oligotrophica]
MALPPTPSQSSSEFLPKLVTTLREGYRPADLRADALAGLTVAIVALPLSMAIAIASGVGPERGLFTTIIGGFLVSALGGSRFQIGGPAGAFIVLVSACAAEIGVQGLLLATLLSGIFLVLLALLRAGSYVRFIPYPVTIGFTSGIAVIIFASQIKDLLGLTLTGGEPAEILHKLEALWAARGSLNPAALVLAVGTIAVIVTIKRLRPQAPNLLIAVTLAALAVVALDLPVETIHSRFGALPRIPPAPALPDAALDDLRAALPWALSFTLLGAIESLLSAVVADGMSGRRHRPNAELLAQGAANVVSPLFGGFCVTGTIARTATNVRAGSHGPMSGMLHAAFVLAFMLVAAPLAGFIPLAALAAVLAVVAWNMAEKEEMWALARHSRADAVVLLATFGLVVFRDLTEGIVVGFALAGLVFINRMSAGTTIRESRVPIAVLETEGEVESGVETAGDVVIYHLSGPWFFGAAARLGSVLDQVSDHPRAFAVDFAEVPLIDSSGAYSFALLARKMARKGGRLVISGARPEVRRALRRAGTRGNQVIFIPNLAALPNAVSKAIPA